MPLTDAGVLEVRERDFDAAGWTSLVGRAPGFSLLQTWEYGRAKCETGPWRMRHVVLEDAGKVLAGAQVMLRDLPLAFGGLAWINRGPLLLGETPRKGLLAGVLRALRRHFVEERGYYLRLAPSWDGGLCEEEVAGSGLRPAGAPGWASGRLDLSAPLEELRAGLRKNWRSALSKAEKDDLGVRSGEDGVEAFLAGYRRFLESRGFETGVTPELLRALHRAQPRGRKLRALCAGPEDAPFGGVLIASYGDTAEYLAAFRDDEGNRRNVGQLLLWRAIGESRDAGARWFDLGGLDPATTVSGIAKFKEGLGARAYRLADELEGVGGVAGRLVRWRVRRARSR